MHEAMNKNEELRAKLKATRAELSGKERVIELGRRQLERVTAEKNELAVRRRQPL